MTALLHDFRPLVQYLQLVLIHDERLLFQTEIASTRLLTVSRGLLDNSPLDVEVDSSSFEFPNVSPVKTLVTRIFRAGIAWWGFLYLRVA